MITITFYVVNQIKMALNEPKQVYLEIKDTRKILITHCSYIECRALKRNKQAPSCSRDCQHITE